MGPSREAALEGSIRLGLKPIEAIGWDASSPPFSIATAEDLHMRVHLMLTGKSVYWANILNDRKVPTFVLPGLLWMRR